MGRDDAPGEGDVGDIAAEGMDARVERQRGSYQPVMLSRAGG